MRFSYECVRCLHNSLEYRREIEAANGLTCSEPVKLTELREFDMTELSILSESSSTFFFPLRTNVQYFDTAEARLKLEERVKQASLLHDKLLFEGGLYTASSWEEGG